MEGGGCWYINKMGCYDIVNVECANCGERTSSQTKVLGECSLRFLKERNAIDNSKYANCYFGLKNKCEHCGKQVNILINQQFIIKAINDDPTIYEFPYYIETYWGEVKEIKKELKEVKK